MLLAVCTYTVCNARNWKSLNLPQNHVPYLFFGDQSLKEECIADNKCPYKVEKKNFNVLAAFRPENLFASSSKTAFVLELIIYLTCLILSMVGIMNSFSHSRVLFRHLSSGYYRALQTRTCALVMKKAVNLRTDS